MENNLEKAIAQYEKAGEEVRNAAWIEFVDKRADISDERARAFGERLLEAQMNGSRAERAVLEAAAITVARNKALQK